MTVDRHGLRLAGLEPPQVGEGEPDRAQRRRAGAGDAPRRDEHRVFAAGEGQRIVGALGPVELAQDVVGEVSLICPP